MTLQTAIVHLDLWVGSFETTKKESDIHIGFFFLH